MIVVPTRQMLPKIHNTIMLLHCHAKEEPIMCHFRLKDNFAEEYVFCLQFVQDLRISFRFYIYIYYIEN